MVNILSPSGLEDPLGGEAHSRAMLSRNWGRINLGLGSTATANAIVNGATWDTTGSTFIRLAIGNTGIVVASYNILSKTTTGLPARNLAGNSVSGTPIAPPGFRNKYTINYQGAIASGAGVGDSVQVLILGGGEVLLRSDTTATYNTVVGSAIRLVIAYEWDGNLT